ncbi:capsule biosynthesis protein [Roseovarius sp. SYSU LYC5161]|jgi:capsular polysaccharide export protein|uniref:capsule biosynthesis protein n=1 Tax=Roseovarius halophilus (ex Wu et al. 2025) TaxID=3376060 RepID=UPI00399C454B
MTRQTRIETDPRRKTFLFLQGPHGPFFDRLGRMSTRAGATVWRVGFNAGDRAFWFTPDTYIPYRGPVTDWPSRFRALVAEKGVTDIVLYGDTRPVHAQAVAAAQDLGLTVHVFEEGYMRPYWVSYERGGSNGHSRLMDIDVDQMRRDQARTETHLAEAPAQWGDMRQHVFYGALYHWFVMFRNRAYRNFRPHRDLPVMTETLLYTRRLLLMPAIALDRIWSTLRIKRGGYPYHLALLQLEHDSSFRQHSPFSSMTEFLDIVIAGFARGAPRHHHLVFKAHPLENGQSPLKRIIRARAKAHGVADRIHYVRGGKLAQLLDHARTAVTVNSTAAQQVLHRGIPLRIFGDAVYAKPGLVSDQPLEEFFARPERPDTAAYGDFRRFLLETSQVAGGFYSARGRRQLLRQVVDMMLDPDDPYEALRLGKAPPRQQLHAIK